MGCAAAKPEIRVVVKTGDLKFSSGTDNKVTLVLVDQKGQRSRELPLDKPWRDDFKRGKTDVFDFIQLSKMAPIVVIELSKSGSDDWFVEHVLVENFMTGTVHPFPVSRWITEDTPLLLQEFDSHLPMDSRDLAARKRELDIKQAVYLLEQKIEGLPPQVKDLPKSEEFSDTEYMVDVATLTLNTTVDEKLLQLAKSEWKTLEDVRNFYGGTFHQPESATRDWSSDKYFGEQRLSGCNPVTIKLCTQLPNNFPVTDELVGPFLGGLKLQDAISKKRLFIEDLSCLDNLPITFPDKYKVCAPFILFYHTEEKCLVPVAIQLYPTPAADNPIFVPSDPKYTWILAKMWANNANAQMHESYTHLGSTHLRIESVAVAANRQLSPSHPVFRLMAPHFLYTMAINSLALQSLVNEGGFIDRALTMGRIGTFEIIKRCGEDWRMDVQGIIPNDLENRGLRDRHVLPHYPYRDAAMLLHRAIDHYVRNCLTSVYDTPEKIKEDEELQAWAKELSGEIKDGGCGLKGVPGGGSFNSLEDIVLTVVYLISTSSVLHAAVNFNQYDQFGFPPAYPGLLRGEPPKDKSEVGEADVLQALPTQESTGLIMSVTRRLSQKATQSLGHFEISYLYDHKSLEALRTFRDDLKKAEAEMMMQNDRNTREIPYEVLYPSGIPNAISI